MKDPRAGSLDHYAIRELANRVEGNYLSRWGSVVATQQYSVEDFARNVAAHLLDVGFSAQHLHAFVKFRIVDTALISLQDLCNELQVEIQAQQPRTFEVMLAFQALPEQVNGPPLFWLRGPAVVT